MTLTTNVAAGFIAGGNPEENVTKEEKEKGNYEVITGFCIGNAVNVWPGDVIALTADESRRWVGLELVKPTDKPVGPAKREAAKVRNQDPKGISTQDPR